jgi:hypothetical protein
VDIPGGYPVSYENVSTFSTRGLPFSLEAVSTRFDGLQEGMVSSNSITVTPTPEPATAALAYSGLAAAVLGGARRVKKWRHRGPR